MGVLRELFDLFLPPVCLSCGRRLPAQREVDLCDDCLMLVERTEHTCEVCGRPWTQGNVCDECRRRKPAFDRAVAPFVYGGPIKDLILDLKYAKASYNVRFLAEAMVWELKRRGIEELELATSIPAPFSRFISRGYNQAALLAKEVASLLGLPFEGAVLGVRGKGSQKGKGPRERWEERQSAFFVRRGWSFDGETILLVDDVVTTGATADACARVLKEAGAGRVIVVSAARAGT